MNRDDMNGLAFDLHERYKVLQTIGRSFSRPGTTLRVLDVGGHTPVLWDGFTSLASEVLNSAFTVVADLRTENGLSNYVRASADRLPFPDGSFDLVCALDVLEHIPFERRAASLDEMLRVSCDGLYVTFPFAAPSNWSAESMLTDFLEAYDLKIPQLYEHLEYGLPDRHEIHSLLAGRNHSMISFGHGNTDVWLLMMLTYHMLRGSGMDSFVRELNRRFNTSFADRDWEEPHYRECVLVSKRKSVQQLADLESDLKKRASETSLGDSVLRLCYLALQLTYTGKVVADKDRHARNLESALQQAEISRHETESSLKQAQSAQIAALCGAVQDLHNTLGGAVQDLRDTLGAVGQLNERMERLEDIFRSTLSKSDSAVLDLARRTDLLGSRVSQIQGQCGTNAAQTRAILDSRIWRSLSAAGGIVLQGQAKLAGVPQMIKRLARRGGKPHASAALLCCDQPSGDAPRSGLITVRGWALAASGIERVEVAVDGGMPATASTGLLRPDVGRAHAGVPGASRSGFQLDVDSSTLADGEHRLVLRAVAGDGSVQTCEVPVLIDHDHAYSSDYDRWIAEFETPEDRTAAATCAQLREGPLISVLMPVFRVQEADVRCAIESVRRQSYSRWELCIVDDGSESEDLSALLRFYAQRDRRIRLSARAARGGISLASNDALALAGGDYIALLDHDDELSPHALFYIAEAIASAPDAELLYSDEDKIDSFGRRHDPFFKPDWSPDLLLSENYVCHLLVVRRDLLLRVGGFRSDYDGSQDYDLLLRLSGECSRTVHIPRVLYHWRTATGSTAGGHANKPYAVEAARRALLDHLDRRQIRASVEAGCAPGRWRVRYQVADEPRVSVIIASGGDAEILSRNLAALADNTGYRNFEIVIIDNSRHSRIERLVSRWERNGRRARYLDWRYKPFNYSQINNHAARQCSSPLLLFLNDDTEAISAGWLEAMVELGARPEVGAVGAKLLYPDGRIQHAGVVMGLFENCGHAFKGLDGAAQHYFDLPDVIRNVSAVTGACLLTKAEVFWQAGGFDESDFAVAFNDIDLCLKIGDLGYRVLYTPHAVLYHYEAFSKTDKDLIPNPKEVLRMQEKWAGVIAHDPAYNPNLTRTAEDFSLRIKA